MKKKAILTRLMYVLPLLVVFVALSPSGVTVFDGENTVSYTWFQPVTNSSVGWCATVSGLLNYVLFALAVVYGLTKKTWCVRGIRNVAFVAGCIAAAPNLVRADIMVLPNVFGALLLLADAAVAFTILKDPLAEETARLPGKQLKKK